jgi:hypothetical protein
MPDRRKSTPRRKPRTPKPKQPRLFEPPRYYDEADGLRRTLLYKVTKPLERNALLYLSRMLHRLLHEDGSFWHELPDSLPEVELRAAAEDLVHLAEFLRLLNVEHGFDPYDDEDKPKLRLCRLAERLSFRVLKVADAIGAALPPEETGAA